MNSVLRVWVAACVVVIALGAGFAADNKAPDLRPDLRLDQVVTLSVIYDSLEEFCARLRQMTAGPDGDGHLYRQGSDALDAAERGDSSTGGLASAEQVTVPSPSVPVEITCDPAIREHKVVVRVREQPLREVMRQIALLFDFTWMQGPQEHPRYHLVQSEYRAQLGPAFRERYLGERGQRANDTFKNAVRGLRASDDELRALARTDPEAVAVAVAARDNGLALGLTVLDEAAIDALVEGREVSLPFTSLPAEAQRAAKERLLIAIESRQWHDELEQGIPVAEYETRKEMALAQLPEWEQGWRWGQAWVRYKLYGGLREQLVMAELDVGPVGDATNPVKDWAFGVMHLNASPWSGYARRLSLVEDGRYGHLFEDDPRVARARRLSDDYGIDVLEQARKEDEKIVPEWARWDAPAEEPQASRELVEIKPEHYWMSELLLQAAEKLDIDLVADCYWTHSPADHPRPERSQLAPLYPSIRGEKRTYFIDANPDYALQRLCERRAYGWVRDGEFYRARNLLWFVDDPEEVPASFLNEWMRRTKYENEISVDDYIWAVTDLSLKHAHNLQWTDYKEGEPLILSHPMNNSYNPMKLYSMLSAGLRAQAEREGIGLYTELPGNLAPLVKKVWDPAETRGRPSEYSDMGDNEYTQILTNLRLWAGYRTCGGYEPVSISPDAKRRRYFFIELWVPGVGPDWNDETPLPEADLEGRFWRWWYHLYDVGPDGKPQERE